MNAKAVSQIVTKQERVSHDSWVMSHRYVILSHYEIV